jgi:hypothetical protein
MLRGFLSIAARRDVMVGFLLAAALPTIADEKDGKSLQRDVARERLAVMTSRIESIDVTSTDPEIPKKMQATPLFRYDDETRGYVDGTVWRLGEKGRPLAIITAELHPHHPRAAGPRILYDFLSLTDRPFTARSADVPGWSPGGSAVVLKPLDKAPPPAVATVKRLTQLKEQARRFTATQEVHEAEKTFVHLRLIPREIDRYAAAPHELADGAIFLFVNGRNPALLLVVETDGKGWQYGVGRLSMPSTLEVRLDDTVVWSQPRIVSALGWSESYNASNSPAEFP